MRKHHSSKHTSSTSLWLWVIGIIVLAVAVVAMLVPGFQPVGFAQSQPEENSENDRVSIPSVYCGQVPLLEKEMRIQHFKTVGSLREALDNADITSTLPLPLACVFDCGIRLLPATNGEDFLKLMSVTNFGETLNAYVCNLPMVPVHNLKDERIVIV